MGRQHQEVAGDVPERGEWVNGRGLTHITDLYTVASYSNRQVDLAKATSSEYAGHERHLTRSVYMLASGMDNLIRYDGVLL